MSTKINDALDRRAAVRLGACGAAATALGVATATDAGAAAGQAVLQGRANAAGTAGTSLTSSGSAITLTVKNTGTGAGAFFFAQNNNGFAGGTGAANRYGLSAANTGPLGNGAALAASGGNNTGILANTTHENSFALEAVNLAESSSSGGGVLVDGGANPALVTLGDSHVPSVISIGNTFLVDGYHVALTRNSAVYGAFSGSMGEVAFDGRATLDANGAATVDLSTSFVWADLTLEWSKLSVTPNSGPMPNLWMTDAPKGGLIQGGTPGGRVTWRIVANRTDLPGSISLPVDVRSSGGSALDQVRRTVASVRTRVRRG